MLMLPYTEEGISSIGTSVLLQRISAHERCVQYVDMTLGLLTEATEWVNVCWVLGLRISLSHEKRCHQSPRTKCHVPFTVQLANCGGALYRVQKNINAVLVAM